MNYFVIVICGIFIGIGLSSSPFVFPNESEAVYLSSAFSWGLGSAFLIALGIFNVGEWKDPLKRKARTSMT
jgi:hypothetical protein